VLAKSMTVHAATAWRRISLLAGGVAKRGTPTQSGARRFRNSLASKQQADLPAGPRVNIPARAHGKNESRFLR
jgi:hypothetical protein